MSFFPKEIRNREGERLDYAFHQGAREGAMVIIGHGVTADKDRDLLRACATGLSEKGWSCLRFSFSGNGQSEGCFKDSTIMKELADLQAVLNTMPSETKIIYLGHSMGGAVGVKTAVSDKRVRCLISLAGMVDTAGFYQREFGDLKAGEDVMWEEESCPLSEAFKNDLTEIGDLVEDAKMVSAAWLLIHGTADDVVLVDDSRNAFAVAQCEKKLIEIPDAGHMFSEKDYPVIVSEIADWLAKYIE